MTKQDYIKLADALRDDVEWQRQNIPYCFKPDLLDALCIMLQRDNPNFRARRFVGYVNGECGPNGGDR